MPRFDVFGNTIEVNRQGDRWDVRYVGSEGKHRAAHDVVIPASVPEEALEQFLADFFHEYATPAQSEVRRLGG